MRCTGKPPVKVGQVLEVKLQSEAHRLRVRAQTVWIIELKAVGLAERARGQFSAVHSVAGWLVT